ncbi:MAG TPA: hypothetical protein VFI47_26335 [Acidimicrobiales bacterium]|nr:hypothetical protein [Acidimicrobiales bacterium]
MPLRAIPADTTSLFVVPWADAVIDQVGYDPRAVYVERFWLGILGPSAVWLLRHLVDRLDAAPDGTQVDLDECATSLGLGRRPGAMGAFPRTVTRCCQFGAARLVTPTTLAVRRRLPPLTRRQVARLPRPLQADHARWVDRPPLPVDDGLVQAARQLALSVLALGEGGDFAERQLHRWRFPPAVANEAAAWAVAQHAATRR